MVQDVYAIKKTVFCFSTDWTRLSAAEALYQILYPQHEIISTHDFSTLLFLIELHSSQCLILDMAARNNVAVLNELRARCRHVPVIILQDRVFLSDRAVAEYFGHIYLIDTYRMHPDGVLQELQVWNQGGGACGNLLPVNSKLASSKKTVLEGIQTCIHQQLLRQLRSASLSDEFMGWFADGKCVKQIAFRESVHVKLVYQRRSLLSRYLGVRTRDLPSALSVKWNEQHISSTVSGGWPVSSTGPLQRNISKCTNDSTFSQISGVDLLIPGQVDPEYLSGLINICSIRNQKMVRALELVLVHGITRKNACASESVAMSFLSVKIKQLQSINSVIHSILPFRGSNCGKCATHTSFKSENEDCRRRVTRIDT